MNKNRKSLLYNKYTMWIKDIIEKEYGHLTNKEKVEKIKNNLNNKK